MLTTRTYPLPSFGSVLSARSPRRGTSVARLSTRCFSSRSYASGRTYLTSLPRVPRSERHVQLVFGSANPALCARNRRPTSAAGRMLALAKCQGSPSVGAAHFPRLRDGVTRLGGRLLRL